jgi:hypothetical protein
VYMNRPVPHPKPFRRTRCWSITIYCEGREGVEKDHGGGQEQGEVKEPQVLEDDVAGYGEEIIGFVGEG